MIRLALSIEEVNGILYALGELPTKTEAWLLMQKIREQAAPQVPQDKPDEAAHD
jgi:hypothetical protein